ncbi:MAG: hypothetical protein KA152_01500 [Verrucomicrobiales bacterium]|nr:hypothetical protein [Verrucomicrobiales bacterium]
MTKKAVSSGEGVGQALKRALGWHWHLLGLGGGIVFAVLSGVPGLFLPFLAAAEVAYLGLLGLNPRFQKVLRGKQVATDGGADAVMERRYQQLVSFLSPDDQTRFAHLHRRCLELLELRFSMDAKDGDSGVNDFRAESLDRMLWLFLKLLHQRSGLERFLKTTQPGDIEAELLSAEGQLASAAERDSATGMPEGRLTTSIRERIATIRDRLENYRKAAESLELVTAEIDKTEQQITHLCEVGMTMRDSAGLSVQIDSISESLQSSEQTFAHDSVSLLLDDDSAPPLLSASLPQRAATPQ